jgi:hypothetical protein
MTRQFFSLNPSVFEDRALKIVDPRRDVFLKKTISAFPESYVQNNQRIGPKIHTIK